MMTHRDMIMAEAEQARLRLWPRGALSGQALTEECRAQYALVERAREYRAREYLRARNYEFEEWLGACAPMASVPWQRPVRRWGGRLMVGMMGFPKPEAE